MTKQTYCYWQGTDFYLDLYIVPRAKNDCVVGIHNNKLKIKIAAPANDGKANLRLIKFLATRFLVPLKTVKIVHGEHSQHKLVKVCDLSLVKTEEELLKLVLQ